MEMVANKTPNKRKSMGGQNKTPAKTPKIENENKTPKSANKNKTPAKTPKLDEKKTPKIESPKVVKANGTPQTGQKKKQNNAESPKKLQKFEGTKKLDANEKPKKKKGLSKVNFYLETLKEKAAKEGKESVLKMLNGKIDTLSSKGETTKSAKRKLRDLKKYIHAISGDAPVTLKSKAPAKQNGKQAPKPKKAPKNVEQAKKAQVKKEVKEEESESAEEEETEGDDESGSEDESLDEEENEDDDVPESKQLQKKAFAMNGSQLKSRKIRVDYTQGGGKMGEDKKKEVKAKNFKLRAMQKKGQFGKKTTGGAK